MLEALVVALLTLVTFAVLATLGLGYLLARQVLPVRPLATTVAVLAGLFMAPVLGLGGLVTGLGLALWLQAGGRRPAPLRLPAGRARGRRRTVTVVEPSRLRRPYSGLVTAAMAARGRFVAAVEATAAGPLREQLADMTADVDAAVLHAWHRAVSGEAAARAQAEVEAALKASRRRATVLLDDSQRDGEAVRVQRDSAARLAAAASVDAAEVRSVVAGLDAAAATALELSATAATATPSALDTLADRLAALRAGADEVARLPVH